MFNKLPKTLVLVLILYLFATCKDEKIEPIAPEPVIVLSDECELFSYGFSHATNNSLKQSYEAEIIQEPDTIRFNFLHFTDLSSLKANFEISESATMLIDTVEQHSDTTINSFYNLVDYTVLAENDSNSTNFCVKAIYPLKFRTIGHSEDSARVGAGDFTKEQLFEVSNLPNGNWTYRLEVGEFFEGSTIKAEKNCFEIPNFISENDWLLMNEGDDLSLQVRLTLSSDSLGIKDSTFYFKIDREQYVIRSWQDLQFMRYDLAGDFRMEKDVKFPLPGTENFPEEGFIPLCDSLKMPFIGSFDGKNHVISDLYIRRFSDTVRYVGLFGVVDRKMDRVPIIKNVGIEIADREIRKGLSGGWYSGGLVGWNEGKIINCYVKGDITTISPDTEPGGCGGLVGCNWGGEIEACAAYGGKVEGTVQVGGLVGENTSDGKISQSCSRQTVVLTGIASYQNQEIAGGGFVGINTLGGEILNCYATGNTSGREGIGGFAGRHTTVSTIRLCYTSGQVTEINNTHSATVGGFIGEISGTLDRRAVTDCYWNIAANPGLDGVGDGELSGIDGRSVRDFQAIDMFIGWDFPNTWDIDPAYNDGNAYLVDVKGQETITQGEL